MGGRRSFDEALKRQWEEDGWCVIEGLVPPDALAAAQEAFGQIYPSAEAFADDAAPDRNLRVRTGPEATLPEFPFEQDALNRLTVHESLLDLAEAFLGTSRIRLYQGAISAKYSGGAPDYEQLLHADYGNHTLVVPRHDVGFQQLTLFVYLSDVTADTAATRMVSRRLTGHLPVERTYLNYEQYPELYAAEVPATGPAGSVLAYRPDVYHRGVGMTTERAARFVLHVAFKCPDTDWLGFHSWPQAAERLSWHRFMEHASLREVTVLGFPEPGNPYWTPETLDGVAARYPHLDMTPWREAWAAGAGPARPRVSDG